MTTIKSYSDLQQSKKLAEILPLESADMYYEERCNLPKAIVGSYSLHIQCRATDKDYKKLTYPVLSPCWSLASLLEILKKIANKIDDDGSVNLSSFMGQWSVNMFDCPVEATDNYDNPIDACYEMIIKLHELKML